MKKTAIIMGSDSDLPIVQKAIGVLKELELPYEVHIYSSHRTPAFDTTNIDFVDRVVL